MVTPIFDHANLINFQSVFNSRLIPSVHSWDTVSFRVQRPDWPSPFLTTTKQKIFDQLLIFVNLYQHAKNEAVSLISSGRIIDLKILQSDWLRAFWPISQEKVFQKSRISAETQQNTENFHYRTNSVKINDQIFL